MWIISLNGEIKSKCIAWTHTLIDYGLRKWYMLSEIYINILYILYTFYNIYYSDYRSKNIEQREAKKKRIQWCTIVV